jgi:predicted RNase H-like HicB family nuclease
VKQYLVVVERAVANYSAYSPDLPGCVATGATPEETRRRMQEAIAMHLQPHRAAPARARAHRLRLHRRKPLSPLPRRLVR